MIRTFSHRMSFSVSVCHGVVNMCIRVPVLLLFMVSLLSFCIPDEAKAAVSQPEYTEFSDLKGKTVSMITGAPFEELSYDRDEDAQLPNTIRVVVREKL